MNKTEKLGEMDLNEVKLNISEYLTKGQQKKEISGFLDVSRKNDGTIVTDIDKKISMLIESNFYKQSGKKNEVSFYCEEFEQRGPLSFPSLVVDPVDGTIELASGIEECCVSVALLADNQIGSTNHQAWLYNPFTGFELHSESLFTEQRVREKKHYLGLVSRSEHGSGLFKGTDIPSNISLVPRGSIAFKLGLLASGACDFVISKRPKNIWDIAAGTVICSRRNIQFYSLNGKVCDWSETFEEPPLVWCHPSLKDLVFSLFQK